MTDATLLDRAEEGRMLEADLVRWNDRMVAGIGRRHDGFVTVIDVDGLFAEEREALDRARPAA